MTPLNPDRFEKMVRKEQRRDDWGIAVVSVEDVINLLRKEHAWMRRQVQSIKKIRVDDGVLQAGIDVAVDEMTFRLAQRRK